MAVVIETTLGDITVDLYLDQRPVTCLNFLKLCKMKYYNYNLFHTIRSGFIAQTGDPSGEGSGGQSIWGILEGPQKRFFSGEKMPKIRHTGAGLLSMVGTDDMMIGSQFFITLAPDLDSLDGTHCVIGEVTEGHEVLTKLNEVICDESHRPYRDVRITHTVVLEDPFNDPSGLRAPSRSPSPSAERLKGGRIAPDEEIDETQGKSAEEIQEMIEEKEAKARATILEIVGDLPDAEIAPPENVLFVCKLNPVTTDEDLEIIFSRFGTIVSCEVIRDKKTGNSLQYAFIEFENKKACEDAYFKMDNVLIDDRRIHVDFSQSVSKMRWLGKGRGVQYFDDTNMPQPKNEVKHRERYTEKRSRNEDHAIQERHHDKRENNRDRDRRYDRDRNNHKQHRERSRSRSRQDYSRDRASDRGNDRYSKENAQSRENKYRDSNKYDNHKNNHSSSHKSRLSSNYNDRRESSKSPRRYNDKSDYRKHSDKIYDKNSTSSHNSHRMDHRHSNNEEKHKHTNREYRNEKNKLDKDQSKTPSPAVKNKKDNKSDKKVTKKHSTKKRKHSTSSSDSSDSSSSSSESSSSSDDDKKKKKLRKKRRKRSTSSSSSESSSNSSSSSSSDSSDTSSSSDSKHSKKKRKNNTKKTGRKTKKK